MKIFGVAVFAALALTALVGVVGASASELLTEKSSTTISASSGSQQLWIHIGATVVCGAPQFEVTPSSTHSAQLETAPKDEVCGSLDIGNQMKMNGCTVVYRFGSQVEVSKFKGTLDIACPSGKEITFTRLSGNTKCEVTIPAQSGLPASFQNLGSGKERTVRVKPEATALVHKLVSGSYCGGSLGTWGDGQWEGEWTLKGTNGGSQAGVYVATNPLSISTPGLLTAGSYPASILGAQSSDQVLTFKGGTAKCTAVKLSGAIGTATSHPSGVQAEYSGCTAFGFPATANMNGCTYTFNIGEAPSAHATSTDIICPAGKAIEIIASGFGVTRCTVTIPAQNGIMNGTTTNAAFSTISLSLALEGLIYHQQEGSGLGRCTTADGTTGTYTGSSVLTGGYVL